MVMLFMLCSAIMSEPNMCTTPFSDGEASGGRILSPTHPDPAAVTSDQEVWSVDGEKLRVGDGQGVKSTCSR